MYTTIIPPSEVLPHLYDPNWVIIDARHELARPDWGFGDYQEVHIPGAVFAHMDNDLSGPRTARNGRHPLPDEKTWISTLRRLGVNRASQVVVYDCSNGGMAVRAWWMLRLIGHSAVALMMGDFNHWLAQEMPVASGIESNPPGDVEGAFDSSAFVTTEQLLQVYSNPAWRVLDARAAERYRGEVEPIDPVAGHIPGAFSHPYSLNLTPDEQYRSPDELREAYRKSIGDTPPDHVIHYCGSGVTSIHNLLAMEIAGLLGSKLYAGSWSEWIRDPQRPVDIGVHPSQK